MTWMRCWYISVRNHWSCLKKGKKRKKKKKNNLFALQNYDVLFSLPGNKQETFTSTEKSENSTLGLGLDPDPYDNYCSVFFNLIFQSLKL